MLPTENGKKDRSKETREVKLKTEDRGRETEDGRPLFDFCQGPLRDLNRFTTYDLPITSYTVRFTPNSLLQTQFTTV